MGEAGRGQGDPVPMHRGAEAQGARSMECYSTLAAVGFYRSMGFAVTGQINVPLKPGLALPSILMKRSGVLP
jgi:hypothetical protein